MNIISTPSAFMTGVFARYAVFLFITLLMITLCSTSIAAPRVYEINVVEVVGREGHEGLFPIQGQPVAGSNAIVKAILINGTATEVTLLFHDANGDLLFRTPMITLPEDRVRRGTYFADVVIPLVPFSMSISGVDESGENFESSPDKKPLSTPQTMDVRIIPSMSEISSGLPNYFVVRVTNFGGLDTFSVKLESDVGGIFTPVSFANISLDSDRSADVEFVYTAPANLTSPGLVTLKATATSNSLNTLTNQASLKLLTSIMPTQKLLAWINKGDQGELNQNRKNPLTVWLCSGTYENNTIMLANSLPPSDIKIIEYGSNDYTNAYSQNNVSIKSQCKNSSLLKLQFDSHHLFESLSLFSSQPDAINLMHVPITAHAKDGTEFIGYLPLKFKQPK